MIRNIIWKGLDADTMEFCRICLGNLVNVKSSIVGYSDGVPLKVEYEVELSRDWVISSATIKTWLGNSEQSLQLLHDGHGKWFGNDREWEHLQGCMDIDISLTPFTNSLPINRIHLLPDHKTKIEVIYIDVLHFAIAKKSQYYTRLADNLYHYQNEGGDFSANISTDEFNLVTHYPGLFDRSLTSE